MSRKLKKGLLGILLSVCMIVTLMPETFAQSEQCTQGNDCTKHVVAIGDKHYDTMYEAIKEVKTGDEIVLLKDLKEVVGITRSDVKFTINLNKHIIDTTTVDKYDIVKLEGNNLGVTIKNGKLINSGKDAYGIYAYAPKGGSYENLDLLLDGVTIDTGDQPIGVQGVNKNQNVTVRNSFIKTNTTAIYFPPVSGTLKVESTQIEAVNNGIVAKGGNVIISGDTKITVTGEPEKSDKPYDGDPTGKGFPKTGNAVYVEGGYKNGNAEERPITVKILDGTFISENGNAIAENYIRDPKTQGAIISGGIYSSDATQFAAEGTTAVSLTRGNDTEFYIGSPSEVSAKIANLAKSGDKINVIKGSADFKNLLDGITISKGENAGDVTVNGSSLGDEPIVTHTHKWNNPVWSWNKDYSEATALFTCKDDETHVYTKTVKSEITVTDATCDQEGKTEYKATVKLDGETYSDVKETVIPAKGHNLKHVAAKEATATEKGNKEHWVCQACGKMFLDEAATKVAREEDVLIAPIAKGEDKKEPTKTGDDTPAGLYGAIMLTAALGCAFVYRKKAHK